MKRNILLRTNFLVCFVIVLGFFFSALMGYRASQGVFRKDVEQVTDLTSDGIYHQIDSVFVKPIHISLTMANDTLLRELLAGESANLDNGAFTLQIQNYLNAYQEKYGYESVFLASAETGRYYHYNGLDRILTPDEPEDQWFFGNTDRAEDYFIVLDNDQVDQADNAVTVFINAFLRDRDGRLLGMVGVGLRVEHMQALFRSYEDAYDLRVYLVSGGGTLELSTDRTGYEGTDFFQDRSYPELRPDILDTRERRSFWHGSDQGSCYLVTEFVPNLNWFLIVEKDTTAIERELTGQLLQEGAVILVVIALVLAVTTSVIRSYDRQLLRMAASQEESHRSMFQKATEQLYENIYEIDITHNRAASEATERYFESLGAPRNTPFDQALPIIAEKQIKAEFRQGYLDTFSPASVRAAYEKGTENLRYDFMISTDGKSYHWIRITAHIFFWQEDNSIRMFTYRQNIDEERRREQYLYGKMELDAMTGLYNKSATREHIVSLLCARPDARFAFFILDIDCFKSVNDRFGHTAGDAALMEFSKTVKSLFRDDDVVGRIGGDEFAAFLPVPDQETAEEKARALVAALHREVSTPAGTFTISSSVGLAVTPEGGRDFDTLYRNADLALYQAKENGRNGYVLFRPEA